MVSINSALKDIWITDQRRLFYMQRITDTSCTRIEAPDLHILLISSNGDRKNIQPIRSAVQMKTYQNNTFIIITF